MNCVPNFAADCFFSTKIIAEKGIWEEFLHDVEDILLKKVELGILYPIRPTRFDIHRWGRQVNSKKICVTWASHFDGSPNPVQLPTFRPFLPSETNFTNNMWTEIATKIRFILLFYHPRKNDLTFHHSLNLGHFLEVPTISKALCTFQLHVENDDLPGFRFRRLGPCWVNQNPGNPLEWNFDAMSWVWLHPNNAL